MNKWHRCLLYMMYKFNIREVINGTILYSRRFLTKTNKIPKWGEKWLSGNKHLI